MKYKIEWMVDPEAEKNSAEELVAEVQQSVSEDVEDAGRMRRNSVDPMVLTSVAMLGVSSASLLIQTYRYLSERDDSTVGIMKIENGHHIYADEISETTIEEVGGTYIGNVEGDLNLFEISSEQAEELAEKIEE